MWCIDSLFLAKCTEGNGSYAVPVSLLLWSVLAVAAFLLADTWGKRSARLTPYIRSLVNRRWLAVALCASLMIVIRLGLIGVIPTPPDPIIHDEFSYLLQSDTFASGRLTNPPHPMAVHFESFHINQWPTYQSMYLPGKGLFMAAGQVITGTPWSGILIAWALAIAATVWMLQAWMPPQWALFGGLFWVARFAVFEQVNIRPNYADYWNSPEVILAGALVLGAAGRLRKKITTSSSVSLGLGLSLLMITRPLEGCVLSVPTVLAVAYWLFKSKASMRQWSLAVAPAVIVVMLAGAGLMYYNWKGTGHALKMPYEANWEQYHITKPFLWQPMRTVPHYNHPSMRALYVFAEVPDYLNTRYWDGLREHELKQIQRYYLYWFFPVTPLFLIGSIDLLKRRRKRILVITTLCVFAILLLMTWPAQPHYLAAASPAILATMIFGFREMRTWTVRGRRFGLGLSRSVMVAVLILCGLRVALVCADPYGVIESGKMHSGLQHTLARSELAAMPGKQLVIVYYPSHYYPMEEWVYNLANIDQQKVVWARNMGTERNQELIRYYPDRQVLVVDPTEFPLKIYPYEEVKDLLDKDDGLRRTTPMQLVEGAPPAELQQLKEEYEGDLRPHSVTKRGKQELPVPISSLAEAAK